MTSSVHPATASDQARDSYGFEVKKEYQKLHNKYAPLWAKEEEERGQRWAGFLNSFHGGNGVGSKGSIREDAEAALEAALLELQATESPKEGLPWWQQLRTLVQAGVPMSMRWRLWKTFLQTKSERQPGIYDALVSNALAPQYQNSMKLGELLPLLEAAHIRGGSNGGDTIGGILKSAENMASKSSGTMHDWSVQIEKDLHRTFPGHPVMDRSGRRSLRRILAAYACRNPSVGYCQGMNFVAGCLLLFMEEEDAFWCLTVIIEQLLPGYFSTTMVAPQVDQLAFKQLVDGQFPRLTAHLDSLGVDVASVSTQWFLCVFVNSLPLETCLRVWDIFLFERCSSVLFRVALALVDIYAQALMATVDSVDAFSLLQNMAPLSFDSSRLVDVACIAYAHVDSQHMEGLRREFQDSVRTQVQERLNRAKKHAEERNGGELSDIGNGKPSFANFLPRIQVASPREVDSAAFEYNWEGGEPSLHIGSSKAAATAFQIASSPANEATPEPLSSTGPPLDKATGHIIAGQQSQSFTPDKTPDLDNKVNEVLDRRKQGLLNTSSMTEEERLGIVQQLMGLVARLEEEMFQAEARRFEAENTAAALLGRMGELSIAVQQKGEVVAGKKANLSTLEERHSSEAVGVAAGNQRSLQYSTSLRSAEAHRALRASLLSEKEELIRALKNTLGNELSSGRKLLNKLGFPGKSKGHR